MYSDAHATQNYKVTNLRDWWLLRIDLISSKSTHHTQAGCYRSAMEFIAFLITSLLFTLMAVKILTEFKRNRPKLKLPPGPKPLPIIGNIHQLTGSPFLHRLLRDLAQKYGPMIHLKLGETPTIIVTSPEMAKEIYKTHDLVFASRPPNLTFKIFSYNFVDLVFSP